MSTPRIDRLERNAIINSNFPYWQRASTTAVSVSDTFVADRWAINIGQFAATAERITGGAFSAEAEHYHRLRITTASTNSGRFLSMNYRMEGFDWLPFVGKEMSLSFDVRSSVAGYYPFAFGFSGGEPHRFVGEYQIDAANTWQRIELPIPTVPLGSWVTGAASSMRMIIYAGIGSDFTTSGSVGQWEAGTGHNFAGTPNSVSNTWGNTVGHTFDVSRVMLNVGPTAGTYSSAGRLIGDEFAYCQRYFQKSYAVDTDPGTATLAGTIRGWSSGASGTIGGAGVGLPVIMRAAPSLTIYDAAGTSSRLTILDATGNQTDNITVNQTQTSERFVSARAFTNNIFETVFHYTANAELT